MTSIVSLADAGSPALLFGVGGVVLLILVGVVAWIIWLFKRKI